MKAKTNILPDSIEYKAAKYCIDRLLIKGTREKEIVENLNITIGYGGGFTIDDEYKPYQMCQYGMGIKLQITKKNDDGGFTDVSIPKSLSIKIAKEIIEDRIRAAVKSSITVRDIESVNIESDQEPVLKIGDRVMLIDDENLKGTIVIADHPKWVTCDWDNGKSGMPNRNQLMKIGIEQSKTTVQDIEFKDGDRVMLHNDKNLTGTIENDYDNDCDIVLVCMDDGRNLTPYKKSLTKIQEAQSEISCGSVQSEKALLPGTKPPFNVLCICEIKTGNTTYRDALYAIEDKKMNLGYRWVSKIGKKEIGSPLGDIVKWEVFQNISDTTQSEISCGSVQTEKAVLAEVEKNTATAKTDKNNCNRSSIYYPGQKNIEGVYQKIINEIPECERFIELFAGTGAISKIVKKYAPYTTIICNDINPEVAGKIKFTGEHVSALDAITYIKNNQDKLNSDDFVFLDPPYHPGTRPNSLNLYKYELSAQDHEQLISAVLKLKCPVMIIHPGCDLYDDTLIMDNGWRFVNLKIRYHNKTSHERLYMNYPAPKKLLITKFLGKDCWDRQRIKRKGDRMIAKLKALPAPELQYILEKINNEIKL